MPSQFETTAGRDARLRKALQDAHRYLSGEFYAEALGILDDALCADEQERCGPDPDA